MIRYRARILEHPLKHYINKDINQQKQVLVPHNRADAKLAYKMDYAQEKPFFCAYKNYYAQENTISCA